MRDRALDPRETTLNRSARRTLRSAEAACRTRVLSRVGVALALGVVLLALLLPLGAMLWTSLLVHEVVLTDGQVLTAVGEVDVSEGLVIFAIQPEGAKERIPMRLPEVRVADLRSRVSLRHYAIVLGDSRTNGLVLHSLLVATGGTLMALLFGLPLAWLLFRTDLPGRRVALALCLGPAVLPPLLVTMGGARPIMNALHALFGFEGGTLQVASAMLVFGCVLFPLVLLLVGRAVATVPAGAVEAARLLGGRRAALGRVVIPAILPAVFGAAALVFVLAWSDFTVPDVLGFMLPAGASPVHVFPTEILFQWKQHAAGRAVATGVPFLFVTGVVLVLAVVLLRRSPVVAGGEGGAGRPRVTLGHAGRVLGWLGIGAVLALALVLPLVGVAGWGLGRGESVARSVGVPGADAVQRSQAAAGLSVRWMPLVLSVVLLLLVIVLGAGVLRTGGPLRRRLTGRTIRWLLLLLLLALSWVPFVDGGLGDFGGALDRTPGSREDLVRWIKTGVGAAVLAMLVAVVLVRWALRGGPFARGAVLFLAVLPLAVPGLVFTVGTNILWTHLDVGWVERGVLRSVLVLTARFLPFAVLAAWLSLREVRRGHEEAAALLGAGPAARAWRVWGALAGPGILAGGLAVLVLALREIDAIIELDVRVFPLRIYDKIHFSRLADEANLAFLYVGILLVPALLAAVVLGVRQRPRA